MPSQDPPQPPPSLKLHEVDGDRRMYVPHPDRWDAHIKANDGNREYCYFQNPGEDFFHLLLPGEIYLQYGETKFCLNCAIRYGHVTNDRLYWQNGVRRNRDPLI
jgi:hypothetical protein